MCSDTELQNIKTDRNNALKDSLKELKTVILKLDQYHVNLTFSYQVTLRPLNDKAYSHFFLQKC